MAAELGQTTDPKALIPGEPERIAEDLRGLVDTIGRVGDIAGELSGIDPVGWLGEASNAFRDAFGAQHPRWGGLADRVATGGQTLADFADTLTWGQGEAQRAIELFTQAEAAARAAVARFEQEVANGAAPVPLRDPSGGLLAEAQAILDNARQRVDTVGADLAGRLGLEADGNGGYGRAAEREWGGERYRRDGEWGSQPGLKEDTVGGLLTALGLGLPETETAGRAETAVWTGAVEGGYDGGWLGAEGKADAGFLGAGAGGSVGMSGTNVHAEGNAEAYVVKGHAEGSADLGGYGTVAGQGDGFVGATVDAHADGGLTGVDAGAEAFAGARAQGDVSAETAGITAGVHGEAWAGAGAQAGTQFGMGEDGKFHIGASAGIGLGLGAKLGGEVAIDPGEVAGTALDVASDVGSLVGAW